MSQFVRDVVLPIARVIDNQWVGLLGSGFLVSPDNLLVTARHVIDGAVDAQALVVRNGEWLGFELRQIWTSEREDIAVCELVGLPKQDPSWLRLASIDLHSSATYDAWGYPEDVLYDFARRDEVGRMLQMPDLVFTQGYVRRRFSENIPGLRGRAFVELSDVAGSGCSGGPLITARGKTWTVSGIYVGERVTETGEGVRRERGIALRLADVAEEIAQLGRGLI